VNNSFATAMTFIFSRAVLFCAACFSAGAATNTEQVVDDVQVEQPLIVVQGRLVLPDGSPLASVGVKAALRRDFLSVFDPTKADADGRFRLELVEEGPVDVMITDPKAIPISSVVTSLFVSLDQSPYDLTIKVSTGGIAGLVQTVPGRPSVDMVSITPLAAPQNHIQVTLTDIDGRYEFPWLADGSYTITVLLTKFENLLLQQPVEIRNGAVVEDTDFILGDVTLCGTITGPDGQPVSNGYVTVTHESGGRYSGWSRTGHVDPDGRYCVSNVYPSVVSIKVAIPFRSHTVRGISIDGARDDMDVAIEGDTVFKGRLVDGWENVISGAYVTARSASDDFFAITGDNGEFSVDRVPRGLYFVSATSPQGVLVPVTVELPHRRASGAKLVLPEGTGRIEGRIHGDDTTVYRPLVSLSSGGGHDLNLFAASGEDGAFLFERLPDGIYHVRVPLLTRELTNTVVVPERGTIHTEFDIGIGW